VIQDPVGAKRVADQLLAMRASCLASAKLAEMLLGELGYGKKESKPADTSASGECSHPREFRRLAAVMGKPGRFVCGSCMEVVNNDEKV